MGRWYSFSALKRAERPKKKEGKKEARPEIKLFIYNLDTGFHLL
jgi:hypothetical protein